MKRNLDIEIESLSVSKLFEYFQYTQTASSSQYNTYSKNEQLFYVFLDKHETHQIYFRNKLSLISKKECLMMLAKPHSISDIANLLTLISKITPSKNNTNVTVSSDANIYLKLSLNLSPLPLTPGLWYTLPIFEKRVHLLEPDKFVIPLCEYNGKEALRYTNYVAWNGPEYSFLNDTISGMVTSIPTPNISRLFLSCTPYAWELFASNSKSLEHFFLLVHPSATEDTLSQALMFHNKMHLSGYTIPYFEDNNVKKFNINFLRYQTELSLPNIFS